MLRRDPYRVRRREALNPKASDVSSLFPGRRAKRHIVRGMRAREQRQVWGHGLLAVRCGHGRLGLLDLVLCRVCSGRVRQCRIDEMPRLRGRVPVLRGDPYCVHSGEALKPKAGGVPYLHPGRRAKRHIVRGMRAREQRQIWGRGLLALRCGHGRLGLLDLVLRRVCSGRVRQHRVDRMSRLRGRVPVLCRDPYCVRKRGALGPKAGGVPCLRPRNGTRRLIVRCLRAWEQRRVRGRGVLAVRCGHGRPGLLDLVLRRLSSR